MTDRITFPDSLIPSRLAAGEEYATTSQILACDDLRQETVHIPHWRVGGKPAAIRVRAASLGDMELISQAEAGADQYITTIRLCCVAPTFNQEQAEQLREKNPQAVEQIARFIWVLGTLDYDWIDHVVRTQTGAAPADADPAAPASAPTGARARAKRIQPPLRSVA